MLNGLNELWGMGLPKERLCEIGAEVGSDVPALVLGGMVLMEGRGERVRPMVRRARPTTGGSRSCATARATTSSAGRSRCCATGGWDRDKRGSSRHYQCCIR